MIPNFPPVRQSHSLRGFYLGCAAVLFLISSGTRCAEPEDISFEADIDGSKQRYVELLPPGFDAAKKTDVVIAFHGHGADRWQFIRETRGECRGVRDMAARFGLIVVSPDYRARTSWMGPKAEADVVQMISILKKRHNLGRVFLAGGSMGGTAVLTFAALHPELIAGVCSLNGTANLVEYDNFQDAIRASFGGTKTEVPGEYRKRSAEFHPQNFTMPVAVTTGGRDTSVPPHSVLRLVEKLKKAGSPVLSIHRETGGHSTNYEDTCKAMEFMLKEAGLNPRGPGDLEEKPASRKPDNPDLPGGVVRHKAGTTPDKSLTGEVTIIRDTFGVPHIYAPTDAGVLLGAAWAQAEDNWWQVEDNFIHALGRASELYGEESFISDYLVRALEIRRLSVEEYHRAPKFLQTLYDAYADGFNHWLKQHPEANRRLLKKVEPWHTLALIRFKYHLVSVPIPGAPGWLGSIFTFSSRRGTDTRRRYGTHGNSFVKVIEFAPDSGTEARSVLIFGESGDSNSPHYLDQVGIYAAKRFKPAWWKRSDVEAHAEQISTPFNPPDRLPDKNP